MYKGILKNKVHKKSPQTTYRMDSNPKEWDYDGTYKKIQLTDVHNYKRNANLKSIHDRY